MFTIEAIQAAEQQIKSGADFPQFIKEIKAMGVTRNDVYVINGQSIYFGNDDQTAESAPAYESLIIETTSSAEDLKEALKAHQEGKSNFDTFCRQAASAGVEKWVTDLVAMTVTYIDTEGNELVVEEIPKV